MLDNLHISLSEADGITEPVSLIEAKRWMQIDFPDHDEDIKALITAAREAVEAYTATSLVEKTVDVRGNVICGRIYELPHGPVREISDYHGLVFQGQEGSFRRLKSGITGTVELAYTAGYIKVPGSLKMAILNEVDYRFHNRGATGGLCEAAQVLAAPFQRIWL